jgi:anthranilate synthase component 1
MISYHEAACLNRRGNVIPVFKRIPSDLETPVAAFMKLASGRRYACLLESIEGGEKLARYSFIGFDPFLLVEGRRGETILRSGKAISRLEVPPKQFLDDLFKVYRPAKVEGLPRFTGGAVGYFAYDTVRWVENIPGNNPDEIGMPEMIFGLYTGIVVFDHLKQEILVIANILHDHGKPGLRAKYTRAVRDIDAVVRRLNSPLRHRKSRSRRASSRLTPLNTQAEYTTMVRKAKRYIKEGDIFQVVLSQRWLISADESPLAVYRRLRRINPSPYMFLLNFGDYSIIGSSPEMMVRVESGRIETRPIAGTRPRGRSDAEDDKLIADLLADEKEVAEHTMLLDLGRNDIGRVSRPGTVSVDEKMIVEKYSHVIHIVSSVSGKLQAAKSPLDGLFACFPAGTVSGAPKIRAMEIIHELEQRHRGVYAGTVAYLDFWGNLDSCIAIRTVVRKGRSYYVQAGAGIVADSKPLREFEETVAKARALIDAVRGEYDA